MNRKFITNQDIHYSENSEPRCLKAGSIGFLQTLSKQVHNNYVFNVEGEEEHTFDNGIVENDPDRFTEITQ